MRATLSELSDFLLLQYVTYVIIGLNEKSLNNDRNIPISSIEFSMSYTMTSKSDVLNLNVVSQRFDLTNVHVAIQRQIPVGKKISVTTNI